MLGKKQMGLMWSALHSSAYTVSLNGETRGPICENKDVICIKQVRYRNFISPDFELDNDLGDYSAP